MALRTFLSVWLVTSVLVLKANAIEPDKVANFRLNDQNGTSHELYRLEDAPAVLLYAFIPGCKVGLDTATELMQLAARMGAEAPPVLGINGVQGDDRAAVSQALGDVKATILMDPSQSIARSLGMEHSGDVLVVVPKDGWKIVYRGAVDTAALDAYLKGQPMPAAAMNSSGQSITYADHHDVSYARDIVPIL